MGANNPCCMVFCLLRLPGLKSDNIMPTRGAIHPMDGTDCEAATANVSATPRHHNRSRVQTLRHLRLQLTNKTGEWHAHKEDLQPKAPPLVPSPSLRDQRPRSLGTTLKHLLTSIT